jgi:cytochrome c551
VKSEQYYVRGEKLYFKHCANCHQKNGTGLGRLYPPLAKSDFIDDNFDAIFCIMKYGVKGSLLVNGVEFNKAMPAIPALTDLEISELATYIGNSWSREKGPVQIQRVTKSLDNCSTD